MKKEIEQEVDDLLESGNSHQQVFDLLQEKYLKQGKLLTDVLCKTPVPHRKKKLKAVWFILLFILALLVALRTLNVIAMEGGLNKFINGFFAVILIYIIYSVAKYEKYTFQFLGALGLVNTYWIYRTSFHGTQEQYIDGIVSGVLVVAMCVCAYILFFKLFVKHSVDKVVVQDADGRNRMIVKASFKER